MCPIKIPSFVTRTHPQIFLPPLQKPAAINSPLSPSYYPPRRSSTRKPSFMLCWPDQCSVTSLQLPAFPAARRDTMSEWRTGFSGSQMNQKGMIYSWIQADQWGMIISWFVSRRWWRCRAAPWGLHATMAPVNRPHVTKGTISWHLCS